jgi:hypothetical protein
MIERYLIVAGRIRQELADLEAVVTRAERAMSVAPRSTEPDFFLDSVALNLQHFYGGLERVFRHIAQDVDHSLPGGTEWHRDLLRQMSLAPSPVRPSVLSVASARRLDEYLCFRHAVGHTYAFQLDVERLERLTRHLRPLFGQVYAELVAFADFLEQA